MHFCSETKWDQGREMSKWETCSIDRTAVDLTHFAQSSKIWGQWQRDSMPEECVVQQQDRHI